jgi:hypothetical protein
MKAFDDTAKGNARKGKVEVPMQVTILRRPKTYVKPKLLALGLSRHSALSSDSIFQPQFRISFVEERLTVIGPTS